MGNSAAVLPLQLLGHDVWAVNTVAFSNHPAHGGFRGGVRPAAEVADLVAGIGERGAFARCDAVLSGYLGEADTAGVVLDAVRRVREASPRALYCCDPVIGEVGRGIYVRPGVAERIRDQLVPAADLVTPNPFELGYLAERPVDTVEAALGAASLLRARGPARVLATGLPLPGGTDRLAVLLVAPDGVWLAHSPRRRVPAHGAGDVLTALFLGAYLPGRDGPAALGHALGALDGILAVTEATGATDLALVAAREAIARPPSRCPVERLR